MWARNTDYLCSSARAIHHRPAWKTPISDLQVFRRIWAGLHLIKNETRSCSSQSQWKTTGKTEGSRNKNGSVLSPFSEQIRAYLNLGLSVIAIQKLMNPLLEKPATYNTYKYFVQNLPLSSKPWNRDDISWFLWVRYLRSIAYLKVVENKALSVVHLKYLLKRTRANRTSVL